MDDFSPRLVLLDFFDEFGQSIKDIISAPEIMMFCTSLSDLAIVFSDIDNPTQVQRYVKTLDLPEVETRNLLSFLGGTFRSSFSYGYKEKEIVFIRLERESSFLKKENNSALKGLIIHETLHSVQRQRGMEVRLRTSLNFSLDFFSRLASLVPPDTFPKEELVDLLRSVSSMAMYALKDVYVNVEMIKRGFCNILLDYISLEINLENPKEITKPAFDTPFVKGKITIKDLKEFAMAINYTISLIPTWLPLMSLEKDNLEYDLSRKIKQFVFTKYYVNPSLITKEMWNIEDIFLTSFTFSKSYHVKWFGTIFNLVLEYLLGEDFVFYNLAKAAELVEEIYSYLDNEERKKLAITPILKAAYTHKRESPAGIQQKNIDELMGLIKKYSIGEDELLELEEVLNDKETNIGEFFKGLIKLSLMIIAKDFRNEILKGNIIQNKTFARTIFTLLQVVNCLDIRCKDEYYHTVRLTTKRIVRQDNIKKKIELVLYLETVTRMTIFHVEEDPNIEEIQELLINMDFFDLPLTNEFIDLAIHFINSTKLVLKRVSIKDPEFTTLVAQFIGITLAEKGLSEDKMDQVNVLLVASLIATRDIPFTLINPILEEFVGRNQPVSE